MYRNSLANLALLAIKKPFVAFVGTAMLMAAATACASPITFVFEGQVTSTNKPSVFPIGQTVVGSYTFESTTPDANLIPELGYYGPSRETVPDGVTQFSFTSGEYSALALPDNLLNGAGRITVSRFEDPHSYNVFVQPLYDPARAPDVEGERLREMWLSLEDWNYTAISSIDLPLTPPDLTKFTSASFGLYFDSDSTVIAPTWGAGVVFTLNRLAVPEPSAGLLLMFGAFVSVALARRRRHFSGLVIR